MFLKKKKCFNSKYILRILGHKTVNNKQPLFAMGLLRPLVY